MTKYHLSPESGNAVLCNAVKKPCPYSKESHVEAQDRVEAQRFFEVELQRQYETFPSQALADEEIALYQYKEGSHRFINGYLRGAEMAPESRREAEFLVDSLANAIHNSPGRPPAQVYRILGYKGEVEAMYGELTVGDEIVEQGFLSTSMSEEYADGAISDQVNRCGQAVLMIIEMERDEPCITPDMFDPDNSYNYEEECLFTHGITMRIVSDEWEDDTLRILRLRQVA